MKDFSSQNKKLCDFVISENVALSATFSILKLSPCESSAIKSFDFKPGQFVQVATPENATYLRRPISVCNIDNDANQLWLLVRNAGKGTKALCEALNGSKLSIVGPLGNGFSIDINSRRPLLIGGGVGIAPLLYLAKTFAESGINPKILVGARSKSDLLLLDHLKDLGTIHISTDDGSEGEKGIVTTNSVLLSDFDRIYCCGPLPMMKAVAKIARDRAIDCEVSLENMMACGVGACLCCVEKTVKGNTCVCTEGPVFNIEMLLW